MKALITGLVSIILIQFACNSPKARRPISVKSGSFISKSIQRNKDLTSKEEGIIQNIIKKDTARKYLTSESGFWYYYSKKDTINSHKTPKFGDIVTFNYNVKDMEGNIIYSQKEIDTVTYTIDQEELFLGLREGLKLMKEGETVTFLFPSYQAYGYYGDSKKIGTNIPIISKVSLHEIVKKSTIEN